MSLKDALGRHFARRLAAYRLFAVVVLVAMSAGVSRAKRTQSPSRTAGLVRALAERGLRADPAGVVWLRLPPFGVLRSAMTYVPVAVRASRAKDEPNDIYLVEAKVSPEGVLLALGGHYNLTETSAVDELIPQGQKGRFVFAEQPMLGKAAGPSTFRLVDLAAAAATRKQERGTWSRRERLQAAITQLQKTGRRAGLGYTTFRISPAPKRLDLRFRGEFLEVRADGKETRLDCRHPGQNTPPWLSVEQPSERRPGKLLNWAVDRVRGVIGSEAMQYVKAIAFEAKDLLLSQKEQLTGDTGEADIAADLGTTSLAPVERRIPVDPAIGFPPPPLDVWVKPKLPGEGQWNHKLKEPFIHSLPGLPSTFVTTFIRSDRRRKTTRVYIAMWDPRVVALHMMAGVAEPKSATGATGPGLIPREPAVMRRVAAAMNAGFQALHGEYGMMADGVIYLPPKPYAATVAKLRDGSIGFGSWPVSPAIPPEFASYRQNMTVLVQDQKFNPYGRTWWGGTPADWEDRTHTVRTGICLTKENFIGYFYGADLSPVALARSMIQARCQYGLALDMNAGHSGMEFYKVGPSNSFQPLGRALNRRLEREGKVSGLEGWKFRARRLISGMGLMNFPRYIRREGRDFFYLTLRHVLPGPPLAVEGKKPRAWEVKDLPQRGFPYAMALNELTLAGQDTRVLKLDPRMLRRRKGPTGASKVVLAANPNGKGPLTLWHSKTAFSIGAEAMSPDSAALASGAPLGTATKLAAALCVQDEAGMLVYVEGTAAVQLAAEPLKKFFASLGCSEGLALAEPWQIALGGDSDLSKRGKRLPQTPRRITFERAAGAGGRRIFTDTPVVPLKTWYRLQARRIRYFKKRK